MSTESMKRSLSGAAMALLVAAALVACSGDDPAPAPPQDPAGQETEAPADPGEQDTDPEEPDPAATPSPGASPTSRPVTMPTDCRAILSAGVLNELGDTPLNHANFGPSGVLGDGTLRCIWADPGADTTGLTTEISRMNRGPALDMLNELADDEGFTCYAPDEGTRCEKSWENDLYPVTDGRTLYWRDGILIDTRYSNLSPSGYTASIAASLFED